MKIKMLTATAGLALALSACGGPSDEEIAEAAGEALTMEGGPLCSEYASEGVATQETYDAVLNEGCADDDADEIVVVMEMTCGSPVLLFNADDKSYGAQVGSEWVVLDGADNPEVRTALGCS